MAHKILKESGRKPKYKSFNETFPHCAFGLAIALIYPNRKNVSKRRILFAIVVGINGLVLYWFLMYLYKCLRTLDIINLYRNVTIGVLASLFFFKSFYVTQKTNKFADLLEKITDDLISGNDMEEDYQEIYDYYIKLGKLGETCWMIIPILLSSQFPIYAGVCMIYETIKTDDGKKYMIHEMELKYLEHKQYETPYFELMFAYNLVQCVTLSPNFAGFDGSFCIATTHLRMKLKLMTHKLSRAFKDARNRTELKAKIKETIKDHQEALQFYNQLQDVYGGWLLVVFLLTFLLISLNLYQIYLSQRIDPKYTIFAISGIIHMFTPCYFASNLSKFLVLNTYLNELQSGEDLSVDIYSASWEEWSDPVVTRLLIFMMAKSQQPLLLTGKGMVYFNMQLFISVLQTSYSFFTLISS